jgi:nucleoside-diphosphate-sugar epimerase
MKVLLTGANGFVGSHILDLLRARGIPTAVLLRQTSNTQFIQTHLSGVEVRLGALTEPASLQAAVAGLTHIIHCAGSTKALRAAEFDAVNHLGTRHLLEAINQAGGQVRRLLFISSLSAAGPAPASAPSREDTVPRPVSAYGLSKLAAEEAVREGCRGEFVILRPPGVYGPRDTEFLKLFRAVKAHICPVFGGGRAFSLVFVKDLAEAVLACLTHPAAAGRTYNVAHPEPVTTASMAREIAAQMKTWTLSIPLPVQLLWPVCLGQELLSRLAGRASVLNRQKYAELRAAGWVCDPGRLQRELGFGSLTSLAAGVAETLAWYRDHHWL